MIDTPQNRKKCGWVVDTGGNTKYGIAQNGNPGVNIQALTLAQAEAIYQNKYWNATGCNQLPNPLCVVHFNCAVNTGPGRAAGFLEKVTNTSSQSAAIAAASRMTPDQAKAAAAQYINIQQNFYNDLANGNPSRNAKYLKGWTARMASLKNFTSVA